MGPGTGIGRLRTRRRFGEVGIEFGTAHLPYLRMTITARAGLAIVAAAAPLLLVGCAPDSPTAEPTASEAESTTVDPSPASAECAARAWYGDPNALFGREWLLAYKRNPSTSGVTLALCHYRHNPSLELESASETALEAMTGDLVPPLSAIIDGIEVQRLLLSLPDTPELGHRCPGPGVAAFDQVSALDDRGTTVAKFQTSEHGSVCGIFHVIPWA